MVDIVRIKRTILQQEILRFIFIHAGKSFTANSLAKHLKVSPTAIAKALKGLGELTITKDKESRRLAISMRRDKDVIRLKRIDNLRLIYESGLADFLEGKHPSAAIILFGSYGYGEDIYSSDIDIAIIGKKKDIDLGSFEKLLCRKISVNSYESLNKIHVDLKENILSGILLSGSLYEGV